MAQSFMAEATISAIDGSSFAPNSIVLMSALYTGLGKRSFITARLNTFDPNMSCAGVFAKLKGGEIGCQLVTAEIAAARADACAGVPREPAAAAEDPFPLVE